MLRGNIFIEERIILLQKNYAGVLYRYSLKICKNIWYYNLSTQKLLVQTKQLFTSPLCQEWCISVEGPYLMMLFVRKSKSDSSRKIMQASCVNALYNFAKIIEFSPIPLKNYLSKGRSFVTHRCKQAGMICFVLKDRRYNTTSKLLFC